MTGENRPWSEVYLEAGEDWADKEAAAQLLEDTKSAVLAEWQMKFGDIPVSRSEMTVKASKEWREHVTKIVAAREKANLAKVKLEYIKMKHMEWNNAEANHRAGSRL